MSLGSKLQSIKGRINTKLGRQDSPVIIRQTTYTPGGAIVAPGSTSNSDITLASGVSVSFAKAENIKEGSFIAIDDILVEIPGDDITEAQLKDAQILYKSATYKIKNYRPTKIISGVPVSWLVIGEKVQ